MISNGSILRYFQMLILCSYRAWYILDGFYAYLKKIDKIKTGFVLNHVPKRGGGCDRVEYYEKYTIINMKH